MHPSFNFRCTEKRHGSGGTHFCGAVSQRTLNLAPSGILCGVQYNVTAIAATAAGQSAEVAYAFNPVTAVPCPRQVLELVTSHFVYLLWLPLIASSVLST